MENFQGFNFTFIAKQNSSTEQVNKVAPPRLKRREILKPIVPRLNILGNSKQVRPVSLRRLRRNNTQNPRNSHKKQTLQIKKTNRRLGSVDVQKSQSSQTQRKLTPVVHRYKSKTASLSLFRPSLQISSRTNR